MVAAVLHSLQSAAASYKVRDASYLRFTSALSCLQSNELDDGNAHYLSLSVETSIIMASSWGEIPLLYKYCSQDKRKTGFR